MSGWRTWALYGGLVLVAAIVALQLRNPAPLSTLPSVKNSQPQGVRALILYLQERGHDARALEAPLTELPPGARTVVLAAPVGRPITLEERAALQRFVEAGNTLVYLAPERGGFQQRELADWLELRMGAILPPTGFRPGRDLQVWHPHGLFTGLRVLHTGASRALETEAADAVAIAGREGEPFVWYLPAGEGEVYLFAGADLAQNQWLDQGDNVSFWERLARRGPILFDEAHHRPPPPLPASRALWSVALQLVWVVLTFFWARGVRLGSARPTVIERHRATREYLESFGWLLRRAGVESELAAALGARVRRRLWEDASIPLPLPEDEVALRWAELTGEPPERYRRWRAEVDGAGRGSRVTPRAFARLSAEAAAIESALRSGKAGG